MVSKEEYYAKRGEKYEIFDKEAVVRYKKAISWLDFEASPDIIEIGCKFGELNRLLSATTMSYQYRAVDIDQKSLEKIPGYNTNQFICKNVNKGIPFSDETADYIVCLEVMEHLENATFFLEEVKRVLRPNGKLILSVPNAYCWIEMVNNLRKYQDTEGHIATYTYQNIVSLLNFSSLILLKRIGTSTRLPFVKKITGKRVIFSTNLMFLTRSYMFLICK